MTTSANAIRIGDRPLHVAVGAGHHNASGGNAAEALMTGRLCQAVAELSRASVGFEVRAYTPDEGVGVHPGPVDAGPREVATRWDPVWTVDIFHEIHVQAVPSSTGVRGVFVVYPDDPTSGDTDQDVRKQGPTMARRIAAATGLPVGGPAGLGILSERRTLVGTRGRRLRIFAATATDLMREHSCRFITEAGCLTNHEDRMILDQPGFPARHACGLLLAYATLARSAMGWTREHQIGDGRG